jgi:hypothetical protein
VSVYMGRVCSGCLLCALRVCSSCLQLVSPSPNPHHHHHTPSCPQSRTSADPQDRVRLPKQPRTNPTPPTRPVAPAPYPSPTIYTHSLTHSLNHSLTHEKDCWTHGCEQSRLSST